MARARKEQSGGASSHHVGSRSHVGTGGVFGDITDSSTDNRIRCARCNSTTFEVKGTWFVDRDETHVMMAHSGNEASGTADCIIMTCHTCGQEHTFDADSATDWTDQGA